MNFFNPIYIFFFSPWKYIFECWNGAKISKETNYNTILFFLQHYFTPEMTLIKQPVVFS